MDFTRQQTEESSTLLILRHHEIQATETYKFLGVVLDSKLRFKEHTAYALGRETSKVQVVARLAKNNTSMKAK